MAYSRTIRFAHCIRYYPELNEVLEDAIVCLFMSYVLNQGLNDTRKSFTNTVSEIQEETGLTRAEQQRAKKVLLQKDWLSIVKKGAPPKTYYSITSEFCNWSFT